MRLCSLKHSCADWGDIEWESAALHNKLHAFRVKCAFKSELRTDTLKRIQRLRRASSLTAATGCNWLRQHGGRMATSYPLPEGFSEFDVFSLGSCLLVEGECLGIQPWCGAAPLWRASSGPPLTGLDTDPVMQRGDKKKEFFVWVSTESIHTEKRAQLLAMRCSTVTHSF